MLLNLTIHIINYRNAYDCIICRKKTLLTCTTYVLVQLPGGNEQIVKLIPGLEVYGGDDRINAITKRVTHGDKFKIGSLDVTCLFTPCHTSGHICYYVKDSVDTGSGEVARSPVVFTGMYHSSWFILFVIFFLFSIFHSCFRIDKRENNECQFNDHFHFKSK